MDVPSRSARIKTENTENEWPDSPGQFGDADSFDQTDDWMHTIDVTQFKEEVSHHLHVFSSSPPKHQRPTFAKPAWSYSNLISMAIRNSDSGRLTVAEIYNFMCHNFPYFKTAPSGWKNSVRHNLSLNKCFEKIEVESDQMCRKSCLWSIRPEKREKVEQDLQKNKDFFLTDGATRPPDEAAEQGVSDVTDSRSVPTASSSFPKLTLSSAARMPLSDSPAEIKSFKRNHSPPSLLKMSPIRHNIKLESAEEKPFTNLRIASGGIPTNIKHVPAILNRNPAKRPRTRGSSPPSSLQAHVKVAPPKARTPKKARDSMAQSHSLRTPVHDKSYERAIAALTDNSLMSYALEQSPYKGSTTFPKMSM